MKVAPHFAVLAVVALAASAGVLYPVHSTIGDLEEDIDRLAAADASASGLPDELAALQQEFDDYRETMATRSIRLCADTPEDRHAVESAIADTVDAAGLTRISMDRESASFDGRIPSFVIALAVEGDAFQLHGLLGRLEAIDWVVRVVKLDVAEGDAQRRIQMKIAVPLEASS